MLCEAIDESAEAGGILEDSAPLLVGEVGGEDDRAQLVAAADNVEEQVGGAAVAGDVAELVEDEQIGRGIPFKASFGGWQRLLTQEIGEGGGDGAEEHGVTAFESAQAEVFCERGFADPGRAAKEHVVAGA